MNCLFFCSEEHARLYREQRRQADGTYLNLEQAALSVRVAQAALFGLGKGTA